MRKFSTRLTDFHSIDENISSPYSFILICLLIREFRVHYIHKPVWTLTPTVLSSAYVSRVHRVVKNSKVPNHCNCDKWKCFRYAIDCRMSPPKKRVQFCSPIDSQRPEGGWPPWRLETLILKLGDLYSLNLVAITWLNIIPYDMD